MMARRCLFKEDFCFNMSSAFLHIRFVTLLFGILLSMLGWSQVELLECTDSTYCSPSVRGLPRSKGVIFSKESSLDHNIDYSDNGTVSERIDQNSRYSFKMKVPVINKEHFKLVMGGGYAQEQFEFEQSTELSNPLFLALQDRPLRSLSLSTYMVKPMLNNRYIVFRMQGRLNGDFDSKALGYSEFLRINAVGVYGWKLSPDRILAVGASFNHLFGRATVIPVVLYYHTVNDHWGLEANLPANFRLRYMPNERNVLYGGMALSGANYRLDAIADAAPFFLEKSEIRSTLTYEREIHDWCWIGLTVGHRGQFSFDASSTNNVSRRPNDLILETQVEGTLFYNLSLFIVAPRKFLNK